MQIGTSSDLSNRAWNQQRLPSFLRQQSSQRITLLWWGDDTGCLPQVMKADKKVEGPQKPKQPMATTLEQPVDSEKVS